MHMQIIHQKCQKKRQCASRKDGRRKEEIERRVGISPYALKEKIHLETSNSHGSRSQITLNNPHGEEYSLPSPYLLRVYLPMQKS